MVCYFEDGEVLVEEGDVVLSHVFRYGSTMAISLGMTVAPYWLHPVELETTSLTLGTPPSYSNLNTTESHPHEIIDDELDNVEGENSNMTGCDQVRSAIHHFTLRFMMIFRTPILANCFVCRDGGVVL